jgi:hypothetical protein
MQKEEEKMNKEKEEENDSPFLIDDAEALDREMAMLFSSSHLDMNDAVVEAFERNPVLITSHLKKELLSKVLDKIERANSQTFACLMRAVVSEACSNETATSLGVKRIAFKRFLSGDIHFTNVFRPCVLSKMVNQASASTQILVDKIRQELNMLIFSESISTSVLARAKIGIPDSEKAKQSDSARMEVESQYKRKIQAYLDDFNREMACLSKNTSNKL